MNNIIFVAIDGDDAGKLVGRAALSDDIESLREISNRLELGNRYIKIWAKDHGGELISAGGDEANFTIPQENLQCLEELRSDYLEITKLTLTVGIGSSLSEAGKALMVGKVRGKNQILPYSPELESEVEEIRKNTETETATGEEKKIGEAYLKDDCPYCKQLDEGKHKDDCPYCKEYDSKQETSSLDDCPYCKELIEGKHKDDCPYCKEYDAKQSASNDLESKPENQVENSDGPNTSLPTTTTSEDFAGQALDKPAIEKPDPSKEMPIGLGVSTDSYDLNGKDVVSNNNEKISENFGLKEVKEKIPPEIIPEEHTTESLKSIVEEITQNPNTNSENAEQVKNIDSTSEAVGDNMEGNTSRKENFSTSSPSDLAVGSEPIIERENEPSLSSVMQEDLENNANQIQKEKIMQLLINSLNELKTSKELINQLKMTSPQLYQIYVNNIKYLIEIAKLIGPENQGQELGNEQQAITPENEWSDPFPAHPDQAQQPQEQPQTSQGSQESGGIGQGIGKLPTSATTKHVAKDPLPVGGVNSLGQMKVQDDKGNIRFINVREGRVLGPSGVPVKPATQK